MKCKENKKSLDREREIIEDHTRRCPTVELRGYKGLAFLGKQSKEVMMVFQFSRKMNPEEMAELLMKMGFLVNEKRYSTLQNKV